MFYTEITAWEKRIFWKLFICSETESLSEQGWTERL